MLPAILVVAYRERHQPSQIKTVKTVVTIADKHLDCEVVVKTDYRIKRRKKFRRLLLKAIAKTT